MRITSGLSDGAILQELGARVARHRLENGLTQAALAMEAGVAKRTLERIEAGQSAELATLIRLLRVLKLSDGLEQLVSDQPPSPMTLLKLQGRRRQRVRASKLSTPPTPTPENASHAIEKRASGLSGSSSVQISKRNKNWTWNE